MDDLEREPRRPAGSLASWAAALATHEAFRDTADQLVDDKLDTLLRLEELGLPRYQWLKGDIDDFMHTPDEHFARLSSESYWLYLLGDSKSARVMNFGLNRDQVLDFVTRQQGQRGKAFKEILLIEMFKNVYGGNIVVSNGHIYGEIVKGPHAALTKDSALPLATFATDRFTATLKYNNDSLDTDTRRAIYHTLSSIPYTVPQDADSPFRDRIYHHGYYEFVLVEKSPSSLLSPIFIDYSSNPVFIPPM